MHAWVSGADCATVGTTAEAMLARIRQGQFEFPAVQWGAVSEEAKALVRDMLTTDPARRSTVAHPHPQP